MSVTLPARPAILGADGEWLFRKLRDGQLADFPAGLVLDHGSHTLPVPWARVDGGPVAAVFTLDSLLPLTVVEAISCSMCGRVGRIVEGVWLPGLPGEGGADGSE